MKTSPIRKLLLLSLAALLCALPLSSCQHTLKPGENGLYDSQSKISYSLASTVYEATALVKEYGKLVVTDKESYTLYTIPGTDSSDMLATEDSNIVYASDITMPTLLEMAPTVLHVYSTTSASAKELARVEDAVAIAAVVQTFAEGQSLPYLAVSPTRMYKVCFESPQYPGFYYSLTYLEYGEDMELDGINYGKYFLRSAFDSIFIPIGDEIHKAMGLE